MTLESWLSSTSTDKLHIRRFKNGKSFALITEPKEGRQQAAFLSYFDTACMRRNIVLNGSDIDSLRSLFATASSPLKFCGGKVTVTLDELGRPCASVDDGQKVYFFPSHIVREIIKESKRTGYCG